MKRAISFIIVAVCIVSLCGCNVYDLKNKVKVIGGIDGELYVFSDKVQMFITLSSSYYDYLELISGEGLTKPVLEDIYFTKYAYSRRYIYIESDEIYYIFDIDSYVQPPSFRDEEGNDVELEYTMDELSFDEFRKKYPEYPDFNWIELIRE